MQTAELHHTRGSTFIKISDREMMIGGETTRLTKWRLPAFDTWTKKNFKPPHHPKSGPSRNPSPAPARAAGPQPHQVSCSCPCFPLLPQLFFFVLGPVCVVRLLRPKSPC